MSSRMPVRIISYNVLSPPLCNKRWFPQCAEEHLDEATRFQVRSSSTNA